MFSSMQFNDKSQVEPFDSVFVRPSDDLLLKNSYFCVSFLTCIQLQVFIRTASISGSSILKTSTVTTMLESCKDIFSKNEYT